MIGELESLIVQLRTAGVPYSQAVHVFRKQFISTLLTRHHGNQCKAAKELGVHRNTIKRMLKELGIDPNDFRALNGGRPRFPVPGKQRSHLSVSQGGKQAD
jgi:Fis family transcriptional regulator, factor for inversion stimulation protein